MLEMPPRPSSPKFLARRRASARALSLTESGRRISCRTRAARVDERGQPWLTPSCIGLEFHEPSAILKKTVPWSR